MPLVSATAVDKAYVTGSERTVVLSGLDLSAEKGEMVLIMGPSGSGKTTLLNVLGGIDRPDSGTVSVAGETISGYGPRELSRFRRQHVGFIFQFYNLIPTLTALENVELGVETGMRDRSKVRDRAAKYLDLVGLKDKARNFPQELSGGEQQRVAVARALAKEPKLILADEPTGNLDEEREDSVMTLMKELRTKLGMTFFIVSHNHRLERFTDRTLHLRHGKLHATVEEK